MFCVCFYADAPCFGLSNWELTSRCGSEYSLLEIGSSLALIKDISRKKLGNNCHHLFFTIGIG